MLTPVCPAQTAQSPYTKTQSFNASVSNASHMFWMSSNCHFKFQSPESGPFPRSNSEELAVPSDPLRHISFGHLPMPTSVPCTCSAVFGNCIVVLSCSAEREFVCSACFRAAPATARRGRSPGCRRTGRGLARARNRKGTAAFREDVNRLQRHEQLSSPIPPLSYTKSASRRATASL